MDVTTPEQAKLPKAGARLLWLRANTSGYRAAGGVARMSDPK